MAQGKKRQAWMQRHLDDPYVKQAQIDGFRSRAVYKLSEIDQRDRLFRPGSSVIDLGAAPGGWTQYALQQVGHSGKVLAVDILPMDPIAGAIIVEGDFTLQATLDEMLEKLNSPQVNLVISDMAPNISGIKSADQARAMYLAELALDLACNVLEPNGTFLVKVFMGEGFDAYIKDLRQRFHAVNVRKPKASRPKSRENYLVAKGLRA